MISRCTTSRSSAAARPQASSRRNSLSRASTAWECRGRSTMARLGSLSRGPRGPADSGVDFFHGFVDFIELHGLAWHDRRNRVFEDELNLSIAPQQHGEVIEPGNNALKLHAIHEENGQGS